MRSQIVKTLFCIFACHDRKAGSGEIGGKMRSWGDAFQLVGLPVETTKGELWKYTVAPDCVEKVARKLDDVSWGTLLRLEFSGRQVVDVEVLCDWYADCCGTTD